MSELYDLMKEKLRQLKKLQKKLENKEYDLPPGTLKISVYKKKYPRYYLRDEEGAYEYIKSNNRLLAQQLAQREYDRKVQKLLAKRIFQFERILKDYSDTELETLYQKQHRFRRALVQPIEEIWGKRLNNWEKESYVGKEFQSETPVILTEKGERVRSKSEKILADYFLHKGIAYKYEKPLLLKGVGTVYPDFTILSKKRGEEIYWEHDGRMDDPDYASAAVKKINAYIRNGYLPGERLIITYETLNCPLSMDCVERLVKKYF